MTARAADIAAIIILAALLLGPRIRRAFTSARDILGDAYNTIPSADETAGLDKPPAPGHHRGDHMVIDFWTCGCIYTWTRASGWVHDLDAHGLDEELRKLTP